MKAAIFQREKHIEIQELPDPKPAPDEVLVRVVACGVCGTDVHIYAGQLKQGIKPPVVLGHEIAGVVEAVGPDVGNVKVGQNVAIDPLITCGSCQYCHQARPNLCPDMTTIGYVRNGGYAQFTVAPATHVYPLSPQTPAQAAILVETLACVLNGYDKLSPRPGRTAMVLGAGTVGLLWNQLLRKSPITKLIHSEPVAFRRRRAQQIGADLTVDPTKEDLAATILQTDPEGIDYVIDASGDPHAVAEGIRLVKKGGTFMIFGVCPARRNSFGCGGLDSCALLTLTQESLFEPCPCLGFLFGPRLSFKASRGFGFDSRFSLGPRLGSGQAAATIARAEGFDAHAQAIEKRLKTDH